MTELKFRAWDGSKMRYDVTGFEHGFKNEMAGIFLDGAYHSFDKGSLSAAMDERWAIPMQCTGLKDKDGNDVYEGDLLDFDEKEWGSKASLEEVTMSKLIGCYDLLGTLSDLCLYRKVVGNIYENPEFARHS